MTRSEFAQLEPGSRVKHVRWTSGNKWEVMSIKDRGTADHRALVENVNARRQDVTHIGSVRLNNLSEWKVAP